MKCNKKLLSALALGTLGLVTMAPATNAAESEAGITFDAPTTAPDILNPDEPDAEPEPEQIDENAGETTNEVGVLTLDFVSHLNFGIHDLSLTTELFPAVNETTPFAQVTDVRGTGEGWELRAELGEFTNEETGETSLPGASITLNNGIPDANSETENISISGAPEVNPEITLANGLQANVTTAEPTNAPEGQVQGMGTWLTKWSNEAITLDIPDAVATEGEHTAAITWTLYDAPTDGTLVENSTEQGLEE